MAATSPSSALLLAQVLRMEQQAQRLATLSADHEAALAQLRVALEDCGDHDEPSERHAVRCSEPHLFRRAGEERDESLEGDEETREIGVVDLDILQEGVAMESDETILLNESDSHPACRRSQMLGCWQEIPRCSVGARRLGQSYKKFPPAVASRRDVEDPCGAAPAPDRSWSTCVLSPTSKRRMSWDIVTAVMIGYDLLTFPLEAFDFSELPAATMIGHFCLVFWTVDIVCSFFSGYYKRDGMVECRLRPSVAHYLKTWFLFDLCIVSVDWILTLANTAEGALSAARLNKIVRFFRLSKVLRLLRLSRVAKLSMLCNDISDFVMSTNLLSLLNIFKLLSVMAVILHYIACAWYKMGDWGEDLSESWLGLWQDQGFSVQDFYLLSFHWAIAQFTPAPISIGPVNQRERLFNVFALFLGVAVVSSTIGSLTALISQSRQKAHECMVQEERLRKFLAENNVSQVLGRRLTHFCKQSQQQGRGRKAHVSEDMIPVLHTLPGYLRRDMRYEVHMQKLAYCPFLKSLNDVQEVALRNLCDSSVVERPVDNGSVPFYNDTECSCVYFLLSGNFVYFPNAARNIDVLDTESQDLQKGTYVCEPAFWVRWRHQGLLQACSTGLLSVVSTKSFIQIVTEHPVSHKFCCHYATLFIKYMNQHVEETNGIDDLYHPFDDSGVLMRHVTSLGINSDEEDSTEEDQW